MLTPKKTRDLARSLVAREADSSATLLQTEPATVRVYERLRRQLGAPVGVDGFQALASRALSLAKSESPRLSAVRLTANGGLSGLGEVEFHTEADEGGEAGADFPVVVHDDHFDLHVLCDVCDHATRLPEAGFFTTAQMCGKKAYDSSPTDYNYRQACGQS